MAEPQTKENAQKVVPLTFNDLMWTQQNDLRSEVRETRKELNARMDRLETRMDKIENRMDRLEDKLDRVADSVNELRKDIQSASNHGNIMTATVIGIALAVVYSILK